MPTSPLALRIANRILNEIRSNNLPPGEHLSAQKIANLFDVSRSPVREALIILEEKGALNKVKNRGFFVSESGIENDDLQDSKIEKPLDENNHYQKIANDWIADRIPVEVTEKMLRDRYSLTKKQLSDILVRGVREGWIEQKLGYGWRFLPVAKTTESFEHIYRFRILIEPSAILEPSFKPDFSILSDQRRIQEKLLEGDIEKLPNEALLATGFSFHESLISFSNNPFFYQALVRVNRMRRLMEYQAKIDRKQMYAQCEQHLEIISLIEKGQLMEASYDLRQHLRGALKSKALVVESTLATNE